jgi:hypothetical protein
MQITVKSVRSQVLDFGRLNPVLPSKGFIGREPQQAQATILSRNDDLPLISWNRQGSASWSSEGKRQQANRDATVYCLHSMLLMVYRGRKRNPNPSIAMA